VTCMTTVTNNFLASLPTTTGTTPTSGTGGSGATGTGGAGGVTPAGSGVTGLTGSAPGAGGSTGPTTNLGTTAVVPSGAPQTGFGGASHSRDDNLLFAGVVALIGAGLALAVAVGRRRTSSVQGADETA
jgi:hypothetical protein